MGVGKKHCLCEESLADGRTTRHHSSWLAALGVGLFIFLIHTHAIEARFMEKCSKNGKFKNGYWTKWASQDSPDFSGDWENQHLCGKRSPYCIQARIRSIDFCAAPAKICVLRQVFWLSLNNGGVCVHAQQRQVLVGGAWTRCNCCDYEVRYKCPGGVLKRPF